MSALDNNDVSAHNKRSNFVVYGLHKVNYFFEIVYIVADGGSRRRYAHFSRQYFNLRGAHRMTVER